LITFLDARALQIHLVVLAVIKLLSLDEAEDIEKVDNGR
jgi:hypothetical protein